MEPLASKLRPTILDDFIGQSHLVGEGKPLRKAIEEKHVLSFILWGPPGVGKTTLARLYAHSLGMPLHELSAVSAGKDDIRSLVESGDDHTLLFIDEIHRFNKAQQDFLLPFVEQGRLTLIGATTENPSFEVIPALLSRLRVFVLTSLKDDEMRHVISRADIPMDEEARTWIIAAADGDARQALVLIENTLRLYKTISVQTLTETVQSTHRRYDKKGEEHYNTISAFIKSMRASQPNAALYYLARMIEAGEDPKFIARRMVIFASEDIGMAQPTALVVANEVFRAVATVGMPEAGINIAHGVVYLSKASKDRSAYNGFKEALRDVEKHGSLPIPLIIRNAPTQLMKEEGYGKGYELYTDEDVLPDALQGKNIYNKYGYSTYQKSTSRSSNSVICT